jgi:hypothetical protein
MWRNHGRQILKFTTKKISSLHAPPIHKRTTTSIPNYNSFWLF